MIVANCFITHANYKGKLCLIIKLVTRPLKTKAQKSIMMSMLPFLLYSLSLFFFFMTVLSWSTFSVVIYSFRLFFNYDKLVIYGAKGCVRLPLLLRLLAQQHQRTYPLLCPDAPNISERKDISREAATSQSHVPTSTLCQHAETLRLVLTHCSTHRIQSNTKPTVWKSQNERVSQENGMLPKTSRKSRVS